MKRFDDIKANVINEFPGVLGLTIGGSQKVEIPTRPGFVYVRLRNNLNEVIQAYNDKVSNVYNLPVIVARHRTDKSRWYVVGKDTGMYSDWGSSAYVPDHHEKHEFNPDGAGQDIVWVYEKQFMPHLIYPSGSAALMYPHSYYSSGTWHYSGLQLLPELSSYKPTGSNARVVFVYMDNDDTPKLLAGDYLASNLTGTADVLSALPSMPTSTADPIAAIRLVSGTSDLSWDNLYDLRQFHSRGGGGGSASIDGHVIQDEGTPVTQRSNLNFVGNTVFVEDDAGNDATKIIISGSASGGDDEKVKVSSNDTTAGYLNGKLVEGAGISLTENNNGGNETLSISYTGTTSGSGREILISDRNYYVAMDGDDGNSGLNSSDPFLTINKAITVVANELDLTGYDAIINVGTGTFAENVVLLDVVGQTDKGGDITGNVILRGAGATGTSSTLIEVATGDCIYANGVNAWWQIENMVLGASAPNLVNGIYAENGSKIMFSNIKFGNTTYNVLADKWSYIRGSHHVLSGNIGTHILAREHSAVNIGGAQVTFDASITGSNFLSAIDLSSINLSLTTFVYNGNTFTGNRYDVRDNSVIITEYESGDYIPGTGGTLENNSVIRGLPSKPYTASKTTIAGLTGVVDGAIAYATDTDELGLYNGSSWDWIKSSNFAPASKGVTNGDSHDHSGGDGAQIDHGSLGGLSDDDHPQYYNSARYDAIEKCHCQAYRTSNKSISNNTWTLVDLNAERYDYVASGLTAMHDNSTNNSRIYARISGVYLAVAHAVFAANSTGVRGVAIIKNGAGVLTVGNIIAVSTNTTISTDMAVFVMIPVLLTAGDYVEMCVYQNSGGALNLLALNYSPILTLSKQA